MKASRGAGITKKSQIADVLLLICCQGNVSQSQKYGDTYSQNINEVFSIEASN